MKKLYFHEFIMSSLYVECGFLVKCTGILTYIPFVFISF